MRAPSFRQINRCETATGHVCKCRCEGRMHGAMRCAEEPSVAKFFYQNLPSDDPHFLPSQTLLRLRQNERRRQRRTEARKIREEEKRLAKEELDKLQPKLFDPDEYKQAPNFGW